MQYTPLWTSILRSPKVFALDAEAFRFWVLCLALAQEHDHLNGTLPDAETIAFTLRVDADRAQLLVDVLIELGFLDEAAGGGLSVHNWKRWRKKADPTAAARKRLQRERERHAPSQGVTPVTRDMNGERDRSSSFADRDEKPLRVVRKSMNQAPLLPQPIQIDSSVTDVTRDAKSHAYITEHTEHNKRPLPPTGGGSSVGDPAPPGEDVEPFQAPALPGPDPGPLGSAAAQAIMSRAADLWGSGGWDWSAEMLRTFEPAVVQYGARETVRWLNGRPFTPAAAAYWQSICRNHRDGPPADPAPQGRASPRAAPAPKFSVPDPDQIYPPSMRGVKREAPGDPSRVEAERGPGG